MNKLFNIILVSIMTMSVTAKTSAQKIVIKVDNIDAKRGGNIVVLIFGKEGFPIKHDTALLSQSKMAKASSLKFEFNIDLAEMAVKVWHDENNDGKVTKNWTGIYPKEGLGFSNKQKIGFTGPPSFKKARQTKEQYKNGLTISVTYP